MITGFLISSPPTPCAFEMPIHFAFWKCARKVKGPSFIDFLGFLRCLKVRILRESANMASTPGLSTVFEVDFDLDTGKSSGFVMCVVMKEQYRAGMV